MPDAFLRSENGALLSLGTSEETWIGRGAFQASRKLQAQCSRRQTRILLRDGEFFLQCHGRNPCYFTLCHSVGFSKESPPFYGVPKGGEVKLTSGDKFYFIRHECLLTFIVKEAGENAKQPENEEILQEAKQPELLVEEEIDRVEPENNRVALEQQTERYYLEPENNFDEVTPGAGSSTPGSSGEEPVVHSETEKTQRESARLEAQVITVDETSSVSPPRDHLNPGTRCCGPVPGMESIIVTITGYKGEDRARLVALINKCGAVYSGDLSIAHTHIVCWTFSGKKYSLAKGWGTTIAINHRWFEDSLEAGRRLPEESYTSNSGLEVGPVNFHEVLKQNASNFVSEPAAANQTSFARDLDLVLQECQAELSNERPRSGRLRNKEKILKNPARTREAGASGKAVLPVEESYKSLLQKRKITRSKTLETSFRRLKQKTVDSFIRVLPPPTPEEEAGEASNAAAAAATINETTPTAGDEVFNRLSIESSSSDDLDIACAICHNERQSSAGGVLPCGHDFCFECIRKWSRLTKSGATPTCPLCKAPFEFITRREAVSDGDPEVKNFSERVVMVTQHSNLILPVANSCLVCRSVDAEEFLLVCSFCRGRAVHTFCLDPPWSSESSHWLCSLCMEQHRH